MEAFPEDYVGHNLPLIFLSGIGHEEPAVSERTERPGNLLQEGGFKIRTDIPPLTVPVAQDVLRAFLGFDSTNDAFKSTSISTRDSPGVFKIKRVGRVG